MQQSDPRQPRTDPWTFVAVALSVVALGFSVFATGDGDPDQDLSPAPGHGDWRGLAARIERLEADRADRVLPPARAAENAPDQAGPAVRTEVPAVASDPEVRAALAGLEVRVGNLEQARRQEAKEGLADVDGIPAALAVLLASRGVVTKVGDIEAIQANAAVLADLVRDIQAPDWHRIEAYRGMLMFFAEDLAAETRPDLASILGSSSDPDARWTVASWLGRCEDPRIAATLLGAYAREADERVRLAIVGSLGQSLDTPGVRPGLEAARATEQAPAIRAEIERVLDRD